MTFYPRAQRDSTWTGWFLASITLLLAVLLLAVSPTTLAAVRYVDQQQSSQLLHYWNFNETDALLIASYTIGGGSLTVDLAPTTAVLADTGQEFFGENVRMGDPTGSHLRVNNPLGATLTFALPTSGCSDIVLKYETRRSGQGAGIQIIEYTTDGSTYNLLGQIVIYDAAPILHTFDFSSISEANDNPNFAVRITFAQGAGGVGGNNRFDNVTLDGVSSNGPPVVIQPVGLRELIEEGAPATVDLDAIFNDPDGDPLTFSTDSSVASVATVAVISSTLTITPSVRGETQVTVYADDGYNTPVSTSLRTLVYPQAYHLSNGDFAFIEWDSAQPERVYPEYMLFLQSDINDPQIDSPLTYAYFIPHDDYAPEDSGTVGFPYNNTKRTRLNGLGEDGISFINTGRGRDLGGALLALNTQGVNESQADWLCGTILRNERLYGIRLQYRLSIETPFIDLFVGGQPVEYVANGSDGHTQQVGPISLLVGLLDQEYVQLLWRYYHIDGDSGPRAELRLDNILVSGVEASTPYTYWLPFLLKDTLP